MTKSEIEAVIQNISGQIIRKYKPQKIILFGSAARGEYVNRSDLDFFA